MGHLPVEEIEELKSCCEQSTRDQLCDRLHHHIADLAVAFAQRPQTLARESDEGSIRGCDRRRGHPAITEKSRPGEKIPLTYRQDSLLAALTRDHFQRDRS